MKTFSCQVCGQPIYFENSKCTHCGAVLGFLPDRMILSAVVQGEDALWRAPPAKPGIDPDPQPPRASLFARLFGSAPKTVSPPPLPDPEPGRAYRKCANYEQYEVCNWMVAAEHEDPLCAACRPNRVIPNLERPGHLEKWYRIERGKRRLVYALMRLGLPMRVMSEPGDGGLGFAFLSSLDAAPDEPVMTGHANGLITINLDEADAAKRERMRLDMDEKYRTLLGHFRHEIGHYYWDVLIRDGNHLDEFRRLFGDERADYGEALNKHYADGAPLDWQDRYISTYAASHPWEDWAETWAHYLHIVDTLETAGHFGIQVEQRLADGTLQRSDPDFDAYLVADLEPLMEHWLPLTFALNSLNRSMGLQDLYPFVVSQPVIDKLGFVHRVVRAARLTD
jgi:hypothetical protein